MADWNWNFFMWTIILYTQKQELKICQFISRENSVEL